MNWHARYLQQASWTRDLRVYLFEKARLNQARRVLEVGCGTGAILQELATPSAPIGLDLDPVALAQCHIHAPNAILTRGDGLSLPFADQTFDIVYCHYFLLWVHDPLQAILEMKRVTRAGGYLLALAEPDYYARIDEPAGLKILGEWAKYYRSPLRPGAIRGSKQNGIWGGPVIRNHTLFVPKDWTGKDQMLDIRGRVFALKPSGPGAYALPPQAKAGVYFFKLGPRYFKASML